MHNKSSFLAAQRVLQHGPDRHFSLWGPSSAKYLSGDRSKHACGDMDFPDYDNFSITVRVLWTLHNYSMGLELSCVSHHESELGRWVLTLLNTTCLFFQLLAGVLFLPTLHSKSFFSSYDNNSSCSQCIPCWAGLVLCHFFMLCRIVSTWKLNRQFMENQHKRLRMKI